MKVKVPFFISMLTIALLSTSCGEGGGGVSQNIVNTVLPALTWDVVTKDISGNDLAVDGYIIHYGSSVDDLSKSIDIGNKTSLNLNDYLDLISPDDKCFAVSAYTINASSIKVEGAYSDTICL